MSGKNDTRKTKDVLDEIVEVLLDISESLTEIAASTRAKSFDVPAELLDFGSLHSDGGIPMPKAEIRTYGDPTILSGNEEGLK